MQISPDILYLDYAATTPTDEAVADALMPWLKGRTGNAHARHHVFGMDAAKAVHHARRHIADVIGAKSDDIIFTSGATEARARWTISRRSMEV